jgi:23S rRNA (adenine1618-N6)-methyltransferase
MSADTAPGARDDVEDDPSAEEALASLEALIDADPQGIDSEVRETADALRASIAEAAALAASTSSGPEIGPALPPAVSRKRARAPESSSSPDRQIPRRAPDGERMHPRHVFTAANPDFAALAATRPRLRPYLVETRDGRHTIDFSSWDATVELNRALLDACYGVKHWEIPRGHLCPPAANRANYVHWIEDLLALSRPSSASASVRGPGVVGLDIGVGANCVYPLIGASLNGWRFVGIDVTDVAVASARANAEANVAIRHLIEIRDARTFSLRRRDSARDGSVILPAIEEDERFAFCMCNPPFFDLDRSASERRRPNRASDFGGSDAETACPGGERAFTARIFEDSLLLRDRVHWYTTMCGKKETVKHLRRALASREARVAAVRTTVFRQGKTARWGVAWSFAESAASTNDAPLRRGNI